MGVEPCHLGGWSRPSGECSIGCAASQSHSEATAFIGSPRAAASACDPREVVEASPLPNSHKEMQVSHSSLPVLCIEPAGIYVECNCRDIMVL